MKYEKILTLLDLGIFFVLFFGGMEIGQYVSKNISDMWIAYNCPVISAILIGELVWWRIRNVIAEWFRKCNRQMKKFKIQQRKGDSRIVIDGGEGGHGKEYDSKNSQKLGVLNEPV